MSRPDPAKISKAAADVLTWGVPAVAKSLEEQFPEVWLRMRARTVHSSGNYYSSKILQCGLTASIYEATAIGGNIESNVPMVAGILEKYDFPTYYVGPQLLDALKHSHPPEKVAWSDLRMPFEGLCFMLPRGSMVEPPPTNKEIACVGVVAFPAGSRLEIPTLGPYVQALPEARTCVFWLLGPGGLEMNDTTFPTSMALEPEIEWIDQVSVGRPYGGPPGKFSSYVAGLVANLILVMEARKELVEPGVKLVDHRKTGPTWSPTWVGRNYSILHEKRREGDPDYRFTELGWRAGHFKRQHFGTKNSEVRTIFVDPYIAFTRGLERRQDA